MLMELVAEDLDLDGKSVALMEVDGQFSAGEFQPNAQPIPQFIPDASADSVSRIEAEDVFEVLLQAKRKKLSNEDIEILGKRNIEAVGFIHSFRVNKMSASCKLCKTRFSFAARKSMSERIKRHAFIAHGVGRGK